MITIDKISQQIQKKTPKQEYPRKAAIVVPIIVVDDQLQLLFQVRSQSLKWQPGDICFPGGHIEQTDTTPKQAAIRETSEELGIPPNEIIVLGELSPFDAAIGMRIYPFVGKINSLAKLNLNTDEVERIFTVPIQWFLDNPPREAKMFVAHKPADNFPFDLLPNRAPEWQKRAEYSVYFYQYNQCVIWGLTAQIVKNFVEAIVE